MSVRTVQIALFLTAMACPTLGDEVLYRYEGDVPPDDESAGWWWGGCVDGCGSRVEDGHFVLEWIYGEGVTYTLIIRDFLDPPVLPPTLWVEWRFRSNQSFGGVFDSCDARFKVRYARISDLLFMFGDTVISFSADDLMGGLDVEEFNTYRFESLDGTNYRFLVDGQVFLDETDMRTTEGGYLQMGGDGGCEVDQLPTINEWDFVRFGEISFGEQIISSEPSPGFLDARVHADLDRFTVTFDAANYVEIDEITVEVCAPRLSRCISGWAKNTRFQMKSPISEEMAHPPVETSEGDAPVVTHTRRRENDDVDTVEIVLDRPFPMGATTRFTFDDGAKVNVIEYTFAPGDTDGNGRVDLADVAAMQNCFGEPAPLPGPCRAVDLDHNGCLTLNDFSAFSGQLLNGPGQTRRTP